MDETTSEKEEKASRETYSIASTKQLVDACIAGDRQAMERLYLRCVDHVYALMVRIVGRQDADDVTQQVFLKTFEKLEQFKHQSKLETWLYRLATNEALLYLRRSRQRNVASSLVEHEADTQDHVLSYEVSDSMEKSLSLLEPELRAVLILKEVERLSYGEIAISVGIPEGTVGSRLNRARRELRTELTKRGWE